MTNRLAVVFLCFGVLPACGGDGAPVPAAPSPPATTPTPPVPEPEPEPPGVPGDLRVSASGEDFIEWAWTAVEGADGYDVQFSANEAFTDEDEIIARQAEELSYRREALAAGMSAYLRVRSATGTGEERITSDWSNQVTGMTVEPSPPTETPAVPTGLRISASGEDFVEWTWDAVDGADGYDVHFSPNETFIGGDEIIARTAEELSYRREGLAAGRSAYLRVRSATGIGEDRITSDWSNHVSGMTAEPPPPPEPTRTWRGLTVAPEERCSPYDSDDYRYPQSVEADIVRDLGGIYSPYTCETFDSTGETDIEHIVARSEAHDSGLCRADTETRTRFARDLLNLTLASPALNRSQKGARDAAEWLPDQNRCWFAQTVVDVRLRYGLSIDQEEVDSLDRILTGCRSAEISCDVPPPPPATNHPPVQAFPNCTAMREAGWTRGVNRNGGTYQDAWDEAEQQTYMLNTARDRDRDGHACET